VAAAAQLDVLDRGFAADGVRTNVVELHEPASAAAAAFLSDERAAAEVAQPYGAFDLGGDMA
jgi:hypothetical protein